MRQLVGLAEISQTFVISEEGDRMLHALEVVLPMVKCMDDSKQFMVVNIVVAFSRSESPREVSTGVKISVVISLHEDSPTSKEGGIGHDSEGATGIRESKYWSSLEFSQEGVEGGLLVRAPRPKLVYVCQGSEGGDNVRESRDKLLVEVAET